MMEDVRSTPAGDSPQPDRAAERVQLATKIMFNNLQRRTLLSSFHFIEAHFSWYIATYHVYKKLKPRQLAVVSNISYVSDSLRKSHPSAKIWLTKETSEDGFPHYHLLIGFPKIRKICAADGSVSYAESIDQKPLTNIRNMRLWSRKWDPNLGGCLVSFMEKDEETVALYKWYGMRQQWFKYGIYQYLLYITKYSTFTRYVDLYVRS